MKPSKELKEKQAIAKKLEKEYKAKIKECALSSASSLKYDSDLIKKGTLIAHYKFNEFITALKQKKIDKLVFYTHYSSSTKVKKVDQRALATHQNTDASDQ